MINIIFMHKSSSSSSSSSSCAFSCTSWFMGCYSFSCLSCPLIFRMLWRFPGFPQSLLSTLKLVRVYWFMILHTQKCTIFMYYIYIYMLIRLYIHYSGFRVYCYLSLTRVFKGCHFCISVQTNPRVHPLSSTMDIGFFPGGTADGKTVALWPWHPTPSTSELRKGTAIPLLPPLSNNDMLLGDL
jgi:hypothetical protein